MNAILDKVLLAIIGVLVNYLKKIVESEVKKFEKARQVKEDMDRQKEIDDANAAAYEAAKTRAEQIAAAERLLNGTP